jgi:hypothetical protein
MSYVVTLECGCDVYVARNPQTGLAHTRIIESRSLHCPIRSHAVGVRLQPWELLPHAAQPPAPVRRTMRHRDDARANR